MKRTSLAKRNALLSPAGFSAGAVALALVALLVVLRLVFPGAFLSVTMPIVRAGNGIASGFHVVRSSFAQVAAVTLEKERLTEENQALAAENRALADHVASLTLLLGDVRPVSQPSGIVVGVVARPPVSPYDSLVVASGSADGVAEGMEAFGNGGIPVGTVTSVSQSFSRVTLFTAPGVTLEAWVGTNHTPLTLHGAGAGAFSAEALRAAGIAEGQAVYAPGPGALPLGVVKSVTGDPAAPTVSVHIAPAVNPFTLSYLVLRDSGSELLDALTCATSSTP